MKEEMYDAIVIGAGPAGSVAALRLAEAGCRVLLSEKRPSIGRPVRCAEATGFREEIARFLPVEEEWITSDLQGARFISPGGKRLEKALPGIGVMVDRERFDNGLASAAGRAGAEIRKGCEAIGLIRRNVVEGVRFLEKNGEWTARTRLVIGADGIESRVGRWAGLDSGWTSAELFSCLEYRVRSRRQCDGYLEFLFGNAIAPGGYAWAFPKGDKLWNVGLGIDPRRAGGKPAVYYAERLLERFDPDAEVMEKIAGAACRSRSLQRITGNAVMLVGDAAHQGNPLTGGGIMNALEAADLAGRIGAEALHTEGAIDGRIARYGTEWRRRAGKVNDRFLRLADRMYSYSDADLEKVWDGMERIFERRTGGRGPFRFLPFLFAFPSGFLRAALPLLGAGRNMRNLF